MFEKKIKLPAVLHEKLKKAAAILHCSSVDEFALRVLEVEADKIISPTSEGLKQVSPDEVKSVEEKLRGLGYLD